MDERKNNRIDPWDDGAFGIGNTEPPKNHGGLVAVLLIVVIFLAGIASALGLLNIRLFQQLADQAALSELSTVPISFSSAGEEDESWDIAAETIGPGATDPAGTGDASIDLIQTPESIANIPQEGGLSLQDIYTRNISSVVSISCTTWSGTSSGTGVIFAENGYIVTNCHVVEDAVVITVYLTDQRSFTAQLIGADSASDLAVLHIEANNLTPAQFGSSNSLQVGDAVVAIGDPLGMEFRGSMTNGIISAINRDVTVNGRTLTLIQTNAALNSGNSGGPLINCYGQVIGINTMKISSFADESGVEGLGFAIPSTTVAEIVSQLMNQGYVSGRPTLGVEGEIISTFYQRYYHLPAGLYITSVRQDSSAAGLGIQPGDILISVDNVHITDQDTLNTLIGSYEVGDSVNIVIYRSGKQYSAQLTLDEARG